MRAIRQYSFLIGTRIPFTEWPGIVEEFFSLQKLSYRKFYYCFSDSDYAVPYTACHKAVKDFPQLEPIRWVTSEKDITTLYLTNIEDGGSCTHAEIMTMLPKLYRKYGFVDSVLIYQDIDFFGKNLTEIRCEGKEPQQRVHGSAVVLHRCQFDTRWNGITINADFVYGDEVLDTTIYRDAMAELLPGIRCMESVRIFFDAEDEEHFAERSAAAETAVASAQEFFEQRLPKYDRLARAEGGAPVGSALKKIAKKHGYTYRYDYYVHTLCKRTKNGHYIQLEVFAYSGSGRLSRIDTHVNCLGLGFQHRIYSGGAPGMDQRDTEEYLKAVVHALAEAEETVFPEIEAFYPPTPEWYVP